MWTHKRVLVLMMTIFRKRFIQSQVRDERGIIWHRKLLLANLLVSLDIESDRGNAMQPILLLATRRSSRQPHLLYSVVTASGNDVM